MNYTGIEEAINLIENSDRSKYPTVDALKMAVGKLRQEQKIMNSLQEDNDKLLNDAEIARKLLGDLGFRAEYNTENDLMRAAIVAALLIKDLWYFQSDDPNHERESEAIASMKTTFEEAIRVSFLPECNRQYRDGGVTKCGKADSEYHQKACSKRCLIALKENTE